MLATPAHHNRRHSHKRSAAISGDFDLDFFKQTPSINQQLQTPSTPPSNFDEPVFKEKLISTPSPKKKNFHHRMNSWAYPNSKAPVTIADYNSSSSNETTPDLKRQAVDNSYLYSSSSPQYKIPEATIDLDLASCIYRDPSVPTKVNKNLNRHFHRRTESAPELEDFLKYKVFSKENSRRNSAIFEEAEEEDDDISSSVSSSHLSINLSINNSTTTNNNGSVNSLENYSRQLQSPSSFHQSSTPASITTRRGASATRYQNYYNNNFLLSNALKSSDSLSQAVSNNGNNSLHKSSISSFNNIKSSSTTNSTPSSSLHSPIPQSPSNFKFESKIYDMPEQKKSLSKLNNNNSIFKTHKKSNSLLKSFSSKLSKSKSIDLEPVQTNNEGDSTLTPFDFGEPGPELDLTTMTPKYHRDDKKAEIVKETPKKSKITFFSWRKK